MNRLKLYNGCVITPSGLIRDGSVLVTDGVITQVSNGNIDAPDAIEINVGGNYISPGFIDLHVHGGGGHDFMDNTVEAFLGIAETHARYGTTAMLPTTLSSSRARLTETLKTYREAEPLNKSGSQFIGMHLEGPYFALNQAGAQDTRYIRNPDPAEYHEILAAYPCIKRWSAAPEIPGAIEFGKYLTSLGVLAAMAHTDAVYEEALAGFENGYKLVTHLYSGMSGVTRRNAIRYAGVIEAAYLIDDLDVEIIADGIHLPAPLLKLVYNIKGPERTALITDAMRAAGTDATESILGSLEDGLKVIIEDDVAKLPDRSAFAGSVATFDRLLRNMIKLAEVPLFDAVKMASATPARIMGTADKKGSIAVGMDADLVVFNDDINIQTTIVKGRVVYNNSKT
jgi:N-acetylglucosamine-6-phosphate deacetylase